MTEHLPLDRRAGPEDHVFVMGDNAANSADSTVHMCPPKATDCVPGDEFVSDDLIVGRVFVLLWPSRGSAGCTARPPSRTSPTRAEGRVTS